MEMDEVNEKYRKLINISNQRLSWKEKALIIFLDMNRKDPKLKWISETFINEHYFQWREKAFKVSLKKLLGWDILFKNEKKSGRRYRIHDSFDPTNTPVKYVKMMIKVSKIRNGLRMRAARTKIDKTAKEKGEKVKYGRHDKVAKYLKGWKKREKRKRCPCCQRFRTYHLKKLEENKHEEAKEV